MATKTTASAILASILDVCEMKDQKDGESRRDFLLRCMKGVNDLADKDWNELSKDAQGWFNDAADVTEANKKSGSSDPLPDFPDLPKAEEPAPSSRRRGAAAAEENPVQVGRIVKVTTKRGREAVGKIIELDKDVIVLKLDDGSEKEFDHDTVESIHVHNDGAEAPAGDNTPAGFRPGDMVTFTTKRGKVVKGELVELTDDTVVVKTAEGEDDFPLSRIEGDISHAGGGKPATAEGEKAPRGRAAAAADAAPEGKAPRTVNKGGVSVGQACKEILAADPDLDLDGVKKALKKRDIEFKDVTVEMNFTELTRFIKELRAQKKLK